MEVGNEKIAARRRASLFNFAQKWFTAAANAPEQVLEARVRAQAVEPAIQL
jgi:hypothetical protein